MQVLSVAPRRLQRMLLNLQRYNLSIKFVSGKENVVAYALLKAPDEKVESWDQYRKLNIYKIVEEIENIPHQRYLKITVTKRT